MEFTPIPRVAVSDHVLARLIDGILSGRIAEGEALPAERELAESFQVNRHAVREALKALKQAGLVRISQGGKTRVLDWRTSAGLDVLSSLAVVGAATPRRVLRDVTEMRRAVAADAAAACAVRGDAAALERVRIAALGYGEGLATVSETFAADVEFWNAVIDGSGNLAYRLSLNTLLSGLGAIGSHALVDLGMLAELVDRQAHLDLAERITARDPDGARALAWDLLSGVVTALDTDTDDTTTAPGMPGGGAGTVGHDDDPVAPDATDQE